jgi:hypothetical protein
MLRTIKFVLTSLFLFVAVEALPQFSGGSGTEEDPYLISNVSDLNNVRYYLKAHFVQTKSLDLKNYDHDGDGRGWLPIGGADTDTRFMGHYNGQGFVIRNLRIDRPNTDYVGLFGYVGVDDDATPININNIGIKNGKIRGAEGVGALIGRVKANSNTLIEYTFSDGCIVTGDGNTGGLVGILSSFNTTSNSDAYKPVISKSYSYCDVYWSEQVSGRNFGGLAGQTRKGLIINCYSRGTVNVDNSVAQLSSIECVGGITGSAFQRGEILNCYTTCLINVPPSTPSVTSVGGLIGLSDGNSENAFEGAYWDTDECEWPTSPAGTGMTSEEMMIQSNYPEFDFVDTWGMDPEINDGYPYLLSDYTDILPITLSKFSATPTDQGILIQWTTATEINNDYFTLERSTNGKTFQALSYIAGAGNSLSPISYRYIDNLSTVETVFYRLKQTDFDGTCYYSPIIQTNTDLPVKIFTSLFPNPTHGKFLIETRLNAPAIFFIFDDTGRQVHQGELVSSRQWINAEHLPAGNYTLVVGHNQPKRFIIN